MPRAKELYELHSEASHGQNAPLDAIDLQIEQGDLDPDEGFYTAGVLNILNMLKKSKRFQRPRGENMPVFSEAEVMELADFLFFKSPEPEKDRLLPG